MRPQRSLNGFRAVAICILLLLVGAAVCSADQSEVVLLTGCNAAICTGTGGTDGVTVFGQVTKTVNTAQTAITFDLLLYQNLQLINAGFGFNALPLNLALTLGNVYENGSSSPASGYTLGPGRQFDGFGDFVFQLDSPVNGNHGGIQSLAFTVTGSNLSLASVDQPNAKNNMFAAEVGIIGSATTGFIGGGDPVPEPAAIGLFGTGLIAVGCWLRSRKRRPV